MIKKAEDMRIEHLVLVNPNEQDTDQSCEEEINRLVECTRADFFDQAQKIIIVNDNCLKGKTYLKENERYIVNSEQGRIPDSELRKIVRNKATIKILGGQVGKQHFGAFDSIVDYIERSRGKIDDVIIDIPLAGCYFRDDLFYLTEEQRKEGGYRPGFSIDKDFFEIGLGRSYTLKEVAKITFFQDPKENDININTALKFNREESGSNIDSISSEYVPADMFNIKANLNQKLLKLYRERLFSEEIKTRWNVRPNYNKPKNVVINISGNK